MGFPCVHPLSVQIALSGRITSWRGGATLRKIFVLTHKEEKRKRKGEKRRVELQEVATPHTKPIRGVVCVGRWNS